MKYIAATVIGFYFFNQIKKKKEKFAHMVLNPIWRKANLMMIFILVNVNETGSENWNFL